MATIRELITKFGFDINDKPLRALDRNIEGIKTSLFRLTAVATAASAGIGFILNEAGKQEQVNIAFETMIGSAEKAKQVISDLQNFAASTPFTIPGIEQNAKQLLGMGIEVDKLIPTLKALGDVSAGLSVDLGRIALNFGQVKAQGKLTGRELRDFAIAGVPLLGELAKQFGKTEAEISKMVSAGDIGFANVEQAFISMTSAGGKFDNLMIKQSKTLLGLISNAQDFGIMFARELGKTILPLAKEIITKTIAWFQINKKMLKLKFTVFIKDMVKFLKDFVFILSRIIKIVTIVTSAFGGFGNAIKLALNAMLLLFSIQVLSAMGNMGIAIFSLISGMKSLKVATMLANAQALLIPLLIGAGIALLLLAIEDVVSFFKGDKSITAVIINKFGDMFVYLKDQWQSFGDWISQKFIDWFVTPFDMLNNKLKELENFLNTKANGFLGKFGFDNVFPTTSANTASSISSGANNQTSNAIKIDSPISIIVPEGTPTDKVAEVVKQSFAESLTELFVDTKRQIASPILE